MNILRLLKVSKDLVKISDIEILSWRYLYEIYDYIIRWNAIKDTMHKGGRKLDISLEYKDNMFKVNASISMDILIFTMSIIKNELPPYESLILQEIIKSITYQSQRVILINVATNSGKTTTLNTLIDEINKKQNKKILILESPI